MGTVCMYLAEILLELTLGPTIAPVATNEFLRERSPFPRAGLICRHSVHIFLKCYSIVSESRFYLLHPFFPLLHLSCPWSWDCSTCKLADGHLHHSLFPLEIFKELEDAWVGLT